MAQELNATALAAGIERKRTRLPREEREKQILAAATTVFKRKGSRQGSIAEIAKAAGMAEGALYNFYKSKKEIMEVVISIWYEITIRDYEIAYEKLTGIQEKLRFAIAHNLDCLCDDVQMSNIYLELRRDQTFRSSRLAEYNKRYIEIVKSTIRTAQSESNHPNPIKPSLIAEMIYSMIETKSELYRAGGGTLQKEEIVDEIYSIVQRLI